MYAIKDRHDGLNHLPLFAVYHVAENNSRIIVANYLLKSIQNRNDDGHV